MENKLKIPEKKGWYWVKIKGFLDGSQWFPCFIYEDSILPGGIGDEQTNGIDLEEVEKFGDEIIEPNN